MEVRGGGRVDGEAGRKGREGNLRWEETEGKESVNSGQRLHEEVGGAGREGGR